MRKTLLLAAAAIIFSTCSDPKKEISDEDYRNKINEWRQKRDSTLRAKDGWLTLAGLYELSKNTCTLPPAQNRLDIKITAGEKRYHNK